MKKVGILTFHNAHNWGASLQLYALKTYLENLGYEVKVINYRNKTIESNYLYNQKIDVKVNSVKRVLKYIFLEVEKLYSDSQYKEKWKKFNEFINKMTDNDDEIKDIEKLSELDVDYFICGSDQIWNYTLTNGLDGVYFCDFNTKAKKIAYAASMGVKSLPDEEEKKFRQYLQNFDNISVREESLKEYAQKMTDKEIEKVLDPTLLLEREAYANIEKKVNLKKYLLLYTLIDDKRLTKISKYIAKKLGLEVVELRYKKSITRIGKKQIANIGPEEFLGLIDGADFVITNSFHGTVFSILFNKKFYTVPIKLVNSRIENLLRITNLEKRCIRNIDEINIEDTINYEDVILKIKEEKNKSEEFLKKSLK